MFFWRSMLEAVVLTTFLLTSPWDILDSNEAWSIRMSLYWQVF